MEIEIFQVSLIIVSQHVSRCWVWCDNVSNEADIMVRAPPPDSSKRHAQYRHQLIANQTAQRLYEIKLFMVIFGSHEIKAISFQ